MSQLVHGAPNSLIPNVKRYKQHHNQGKPQAEKFTEHVRFSLRLNIQPYLTANSPHQPSDSAYMLSLVTVHRGDLPKGHYLSHLQTQTTGESKHLWHGHLCQLRLCCGTITALS